MIGVWVLTSSTRIKYRRTTTTMATNPANSVNDAGLVLEDDTTTTPVAESKPIVPVSPPFRGLMGIAEDGRHRSDDRRFGGSNNGQGGDEAEVETMSESYHEILFDDPRMTTTAKTSKVETKESTSFRTFDEILREGAKKPSGAEDDPLLRTLVDFNTASTTSYLTDKLVEDSIRWHQSRKSSDVVIQDPAPGSPSSARQRVRHCQQRMQGRSGMDPDEESEGDDDHGLLQRLDQDCILDLERSAERLATSVDEMVEGLSSVLHGVSALTVASMETYRDGVCKTCDAVDYNIKAMYQLMAKVEELNKSMQPAYQVAEQVKDIKKVLDLYEAALKSK